MIALTKKNQAFRSHLSRTYINIDQSLLMLQLVLAMAIKNKMVIVSKILITR